MQAQVIDRQSINSFMYTNQVIKQEENNNYISPKAYQRNQKKVTKPSKKIILGKPCYGKHKMNVDELKALSRQIKPYRHSDCTTDIDLLVKKLKENMNKAKSRMLQQLQPPPFEYEDDCSTVSTTTSLNDIFQSILSLYPTLDVSTVIKTPHQEIVSSEVTEDQINTWLQRGGFSSSPITMATDQELADLLHFDDF